MREKEQALYSYLKERYPEVGPTLVFHSDFECLVAIMLSAQSTDEGVNKVTPALFGSFPDPESMAKAPLEEIEKRIKSLGLYRAKAKNIKATSEILVSRYQSKIPSEFAELTSLSGVGNKTAWVYLIERKSEPHFPVDTHIARISKRLGFAKESATPDEISVSLRKRFPKEEWIYLHRAIIYFGRNECSALKPKCLSCPLTKYCSYWKKTSSMTGR